MLYNIDNTDSQKERQTVDIDLLRTFAAVIDTGQFIRAAERLNVTQSTVSARIKELEQRLGRPLFQRGKGGATLTPAGSHFRPHATSMLRIWQQAQQEVSLPPGLQAVLSVGGQYSLWDRVLQRWLAWMRQTAPDVALRAVVNRPDALSRLLTEGSLDIAVLYAPQARQGLNIELLLEERLVLVSTGKAGPRPGEPGYVFVDWGEEFRADHASAFAEARTPVLTVELGAVALNFILEEGGSAYFPLRTVRDHIQAGRLHRVRSVPEFARPAFVVWQAAGGPLLESAVAGLREVAARETGGR